MAQHDYNIANQGFSSFRSDLNNALSAVQTTNSGTSRPTGAVAGQLWLDTTTATSPTLKYYDGADDISLATIDHTANTVNWLDSTVSITGLTTTATGTVLTLSDSASTSTVNLIIDNQKEIRFRETTANGTNYIGLKAPASLSTDLTFTLPSADGTSGQVLQTNGSGVLSFASVGGLAWQSVQTTGFTAVASRGYPCNTTSSAFTVTLPASPSVGDTIVIVDYAGTFATNNITLGANSNKINGVVANKVLTTNREAVTLTYVDYTQGWVASSGANEGTQSIDPILYTADFLVIAGGASGAVYGGGGGAGGYRNSYSTETSGGGGSSETSLSLAPLTVYTITVGAGGAGGVNSGGSGISGSNSSISGTGLTTITSSGGGFGGRNETAGTGGSGGGSSTTGQAAGTGTANQGFNGGAGIQAGDGIAGGGGGGASAVGVAATTSQAGAGGAGLASSITASSVTRSGGGGGGADSRYTGAAAGSGGSGGGGAGTVDGTAGSGTANTGSGGGGSGYNSGYGTTGAGGSGVVILRMPTANYSGTTTGSPTVTTSGADTIIVYNGSGSYTG
jgi:hypothetical protein